MTQSKPEPSKPEPPIREPIATPSKSTPDDQPSSTPEPPPSRTAESDELTLKELFHHAILLATSTENHGKTTIEVAQKVLDHWQAAKDLHKTKTEEQVLLAAR